MKFILIASDGAKGIAYYLKGEKTNEKERMFRVLEMILNIEKAWRQAIENVPLYLYILGRTPLNNKFW